MPTPEVEVWAAVLHPEDGSVMAIPPSDDPPPWAGVGVPEQGELSFVALYAQSDAELDEQVEKIRGALG